MSSSTSYDAIALYSVICRLSHLAGRILPSFVHPPTKYIRLTGEGKATSLLYRMSPMGSIWLMSWEKEVILTVHLKFLFDSCGEDDMSPFLQRLSYYSLRHGLSIIHLSEKRVNAHGRLVQDEKLGLVQQGYGQAGPPARATINQS